MLLAHHLGTVATETNLLAAAIGGCVAIFVLVVGHYLTERREQTRSLTKKLEQLYVAVDQCGRAADSVQLKQEQDQSDELQSLANDLIALRSEIKMLLSLFFPEAEERFEKFLDTQARVISRTLRLSSYAKPRSTPRNLGYTEKQHQCDEERLDAIEQLYVEAGQVRNYLKANVLKLTQSFTLIRLIRRLESWPEPRNPE